MSNENGAMREVDDVDARLRSILDGKGDRIPTVSVESLRRFHKYLKAHLSFPFVGKLSSPIGPHRDSKSPLSIIGLLDPVIMSQTKKAPAKFAVGDTVRVRPGVTDPDFPDIPLGGWTGKITEVEEGDPPLYLFRWSQETLKNMHPVYCKRCERDGLDHEEMRLGEDELEADDGGPVILEQPTKIVTPPLSMKDQDDRIRAVFGLTRDDLLPELDEDSLRTYYKYLAAKLVFPVEATWAREAGLGEATEKVTVLSLGGFEDDPWIDDMYGILCKAKMSRGEGELPLAEMEKVKGKPNKQLVEDYGYWFWNNR